MSWLVAGLAVLALLQFAVFFGPPYLPTRKNQRKQALDLLNLKPGQVFYDLGSGDGSLLKDAARRGLLAVGYEINPILVVISRLRTIGYRKQVKIIWGSFWRAKLAEADGIFVFLTKHHMRRLDKLIKGRQSKRTVSLVSYGFKIPGKKAEKEQGAMFLYRYG